MKIFYDANSVEESGIRTLYGGGTNATTASGALFNLGAVSLTESQTISGAKEFSQRPTVNGTGVLLEGEIQSNTIISGVVYSAQVNVKNGEGNTIYKGQPVYIKGADGSNIIVGLASNSGEQTSSKTLGLLVQNSLANNAFGTVITDGLLEGFNASAANAGDPIWLGPTGSLIYGLTNKPYAPNHLVYLGVVTRAQNNGELFVKVQNGYELDELHNVAVTGSASGQFLFRNNNLWSGKAINISDVSGLQSSLDSKITGLSELSMDSNRLLGRTTAGTGAVQQLGVSGNLQFTDGLLSSKPVDTQIFSTAGGSTSWQKPNGAKLVTIQLLGGGGGGGSGRKDSTGGVDRSGGAGGGGGGYLHVCVPAAALPDTVFVSVGAGGDGGGAQTGTPADGNSGSQGGSTIFGNFIALGGAGGAGGSTTSRTGGLGTLSANNGGIGSVSSGGAGLPTTTASSFSPGGAGGAGGGGVNSSGTAGGGNGGGRSSILGLPGGGAGNNGNDNTNAINGIFAVGSGGGGGAASVSGTAASGGNGGFPSSGGGGGGATQNGPASGAGGRGGDGIAVIITHF